MTAPFLHRYAHTAMTTPFEVIIPGEENETYAQQVARTIFEEIDRFERLLSRFDPCSDIGQINLLRPGQSVPVGLDVFDCLRTAINIHSATGGAFDVAIGPVVNCWRDEQGHRLIPDEDELQAAMAHARIDRLVLDDGRPPEGQEASGPYVMTVGLAPDENNQKGVTIDLGGIGKGFALDRVVGVFKEWEMRSALLHGGTSTALALGSGGPAAGAAPGQTGWPIGVGGDWSASIGRETVILRDRALSGSGIEMKGEHVLDPRTGRPAKGHKAAWAACESATVADALSTAFMIMSTEEVEAFCERFPDVSAMVLVDENAREPLVCFGEW